VGREIERKFLVVGNGWRTGAEPTRMRQGYLSTGPAVAVRIRLAGGAGTLTIKSAEPGRARAEWEYGIPAADAEELLSHCVSPPLEKTRWRLPFGGRMWEVDEFHGANAGLVLAECELADADAPLEIPPWAGPEVTDDERYYNAYLTRHPYADWSEDQAEDEGG
jgi:adenylate cyclase